MCQPNNASMEETYKAEVECLRKLLAEKDKEIERLHELLDLYEGECLRKVLAEKDKEIQRLYELLDLYDKEREEQEKKTNGVVWTEF